MRKEIEALKKKKKKVSNWLWTAGLKYTKFLENPSRRNSHGKGVKTKGFQAHGNSSQDGDGDAWSLQGQA